MGGVTSLGQAQAEPATRHSSRCLPGWVGGGTASGRCRPETYRRASGAMRESRQGPYGTPRGAIWGREPGGRPSDLPRAEWRDARILATTLWNAKRWSLGARERGGRFRDLSLAEWRDSKISATTLRSALRVVWRRDADPGAGPGNCRRSSGAIREFRQRPCGAQHDEVLAGPGARLASADVPAGRPTQFVNSAETVERRAVGW